jgi:hypothetical protein
LRGEKKVIAFCKAMNAGTYVNAIGGQALYTKEEFSDVGVDLFFIKTADIKYRQFNDNFVPWLSIIDVMMFNSRDEIKNQLSQYSLI